MDNLSLDPVKVDTNLAEKYIKEHNNFEDWPLPKKYWHVTKYPDEREEYDIHELMHKPLPDVFCQSFTKAHIGRKLAQKIEENESLFSQLEYMIRKTDVVDVKNNIKLLSQHLQCCDLSSWNTGYSGRKLHIIMDDKTPLYTLGCVAVSLYVNLFVNIVTTQKMAPLCHLFSELCSVFGWKIPLILACDTEDLKNVCQSVGENTDYGCTGVVTESADIDSALDLFLNSSVTAPWKLKRIFVQESIYDEIKGALAWKCRREQVDSCADAFEAKGKIFLCDLLSAEREGADGDTVRVPVEAYRTAKEVSALLVLHPSPSLSVWAADSQHAHELALAAPNSLVWINDYAAFDGPPNASLPVYDAMYPAFSEEIDVDVLENLRRMRNPWAKLTERERVDSTMNALEYFWSSEPQGSADAEKLQVAIQKGLEDSFASVKAGRIWFGVERPHMDDVTYFVISCNFDLLKIINIIVRGGGVVYSNPKFYDKHILEILDFLKKSGIPVTKQELCEDPKQIQNEFLYKKIKVICTNFGTIFAN